jgi:O-antigen/teichoic acid export membrane protein
MPPKVKKLYNTIKIDPLYSNSIYLMLSTAVMAFFGFFFWIINARLYTSEQVGIATTLISVMSLISSFSLFGTGNSLIKYLPISERKNDKINTVFTLVGLIAMFVSIFYLVFINSFSPKLLFVRENLIFSLMFILFIVFSSLNTVSESIFIAFRSSIYVLLKNTILSIVKLSLPFILVILGAYGIFSSFGIAITIALIFSLLLLLFKFNFKLKLSIDRSIVKKIGRFSIGNYIAGFIGNLPTLVLPILITNSMGANYSAYFYMDMMIASLLYIIPISVSQSLFAEGSYSETELKTNLKKAIKIISLILIPGILTIVLFGKKILLTFGNEYSGEGIVLLMMLAISGIFIAINSLGNIIFYIKHKVKHIILINVIGTTTIIGLNIILSSQNLTEIGITWIIGQFLMSLIYIIYIYII